jgi:hypothetical protein
MYVATSTAPNANTAISATDTQATNNCHAKEDDIMASPRNELIQKERKEKTHQARTKSNDHLTIEVPKFLSTQFECVGSLSQRFFIFSSTCEVAAKYDERSSAMRLNQYRRLNHCIGPARDSPPE